MEANQATKDSMREFFGEVISSYSRGQAIEDGVLVDLSSLFPSDTRLYKWPVACTSAVWSIIEKDCHKKKGGGIEVKEAAPWVWDICFMSVKAKTKILSESEHLFICSFGRKTCILKAVCGPGDNGEPVITIMLPNED